MSTNFARLQEAGIVGVPHVISADDHASIDSLSEAEVDTLIAVKAKLSGSAQAGDVASVNDSPPPVGTMSF